MKSKCSNSASSKFCGYILINALCSFKNTKCVKSINKKILTLKT